MTDSGCEVLGEKLGQFLDGELEGDDGRLVERHVASCPSCAEKRRAHERVNDLLRGGPVPSPTAREWALLVERAREPVIRWGQLAAASVAAILIPLALSVVVRAPSAHEDHERCHCDLIVAGLDANL